MNLKDKRVLVTGGTGSFGKWVTKELLKYEPKEIRIFSRDEEKQLMMRREYADSKINMIIGDIRDFDRILEASRNIHLIFHAAALKVVPTIEYNPEEAVKTNILGTINVKNAAIKNKVKKSIFISTDKAVKPINLYGMTKAIAEKIWVSDSFNNDSIFAVVRYGNVVGSRGSVIPYFKELIEKNIPLPITHTDMTRFLITLKQGVNLVFYVVDNMKGGEIFVPKISACNILDLVKSMAGEDYPYNIIGIRPGEKIHECLIQEDEFRRTKEFEEHFVIYPYGHFDSGVVRKEYTSQNTRQLNIKEINNLLKGLSWI